MTSTARSHPNIALAKYWGKRDEALIIPATGSLSLTLDVFPTTTTVRLIDSDADRVSLDGVELTEEESGRVRTVLDIVRSRSGNQRHAEVTSVNTVPTAAGLASSAAAFAALATAAACEYGLDVTGQMLSRIARRGSGSACRSIFPGLALWHAGNDDATSFAEPLAWPGAELAMVIVVVSGARKAVSSRDAMRRTAQTSPYFPAWVSSSTALLDEMTAAVSRGDLEIVGELTELSAQRMHASMAGAVPPIRYLTASSIAIWDAVRDLRTEGTAAYATADAGPNVKVLCTAADSEAVIARLRATVPEAQCVIAHAGAGAHIVTEEAS